MRIYNKSNAAFLADVESATKKLEIERARVHIYCEGMYAAANDASDKHFAVSRRLVDQALPNLSEATVLALRDNFPSFIGNPKTQRLLKKLSSVWINPLRLLNGTAWATQSQRLEGNLQGARHYFWLWLMDQMNETDCAAPELAVAHAEARAFEAESKHLYEKGRKAHSLEHQLGRTHSTMERVGCI